MPVAEERGITKARAKTCPCEACKKGRKELSKIAPLTIHGYTSRPEGGWRKQQTPAEAAPTLYMGVELETAVRNGREGIEDEVYRLATRRLEAEFPMPGGQVPHPTYDQYGNYTPEYMAWNAGRRAVQLARYENEMRIFREVREQVSAKRGDPLPLTAEEAVSLAEPIGFWHAKHDGSVSGPEFASLPGTLDYWYSIREDLDRMFTALLHGGVRSHSGDTAGMHISMSVESFADSEHLMRFAKLVNANPRWSQRMSQRTAHSMNWCHLAEGIFAPGQDYPLQRWAERVMRDGTAHTDRYVAINATCGGGRIEFRLPRGTLRIDRFYKNLEWVAAMIDFTGKFAPTDSATFMRWVMSQDKYPDLKSWFVEKFNLAAGEPFDIPFAVTSTSAVVNGAPTSSDDGFCPCGDGCEVGDCGACNEDFYYDEDPVEPEGDWECPTCGLIHDMALDRYQYISGNIYQELHTYRDGSAIGRARMFRDDGTEYEYDRVGYALTPARIAENAAREQREREARQSLFSRVAMGSLDSTAPRTTLFPIVASGDEETF